METLERRAQTATGGGGGGAGPQGHLNAMRDDLERFHQAGEDAISRALSQDSLAFMQAVRQEHGE